MKRLPARTPLLALALLPFVAVQAVSAQEPEPVMLEDVTLLDGSGLRVQLLERHEADVLVVAYTGVGCPVSGRYAPRLGRLADEYRGRGARFVAVNANPQDSLDEIATEAEELELDVPVLKDYRQELTRALGAKTTTEVFVFDRDRKLRYRGAVDDQYSVGASRPAPTASYLVDALEAVLAGRAPKIAKTDAPGCLLTILDQREMPGEVTWTGHVEPIVRARCQVCHRPGQVAPFSLLTYDDAVGWAKTIRRVVNDGRMPPWNADPHFTGLFANERRLTDTERRILNVWIKDGMPRGGEAGSQPASFAEGWRIGPPDAVFEMQEALTREGGSVGWRPLAEEGFEVPREGVVDYKYFQTKTSFTEDKWVTAMEARPGVPDVVHHVLVYVADPDSRRLGPPGGGVESYFCVAVPGDTPSVFPEGYAKRLPAGAILRFQVHYTPNGKRRFDRSSIGLRFADGPPAHEVETAAVYEQDFTIPAGEPYHEVRGSRTLPADVRLLSFFPHMHTRGKDFEYFATLPDGRDVPLLYSHFDFNWQESYILREPVRLPAGTRLTCVGHYDNTADNPNNPDPTVAVGWGDQTFDEMFIGYFDYVAEADR